MSDQPQQEQTQGAKPAAANARKLSMPLSVGAMVLAFGAGLGLGHYTASASDASEPAAAAEPAQARAGGVYKIPVSTSQPQTGAEQPLVTVIQWCDFPDPACVALEPSLQALLERYPSEVRLAFRHYPSNTRADSARAHQFARAAMEQGGKFWEARKLLLSHAGTITEEDLQHIATQIGLEWVPIKRALDAGTLSGNVAADRIFAEMFDVKQSGALFVNGRPVEGKPEKTLEPLIKEEIAHAKQLLARGVKKEELYAELTKDGIWRNPPKLAQ